MTNFGENTKSADAIAELKALMEELDLDKQLDPDLVDSLSADGDSHDIDVDALLAAVDSARQSSGEDSPRTQPDMTRTVTDDEWNDLTAKLKALPPLLGAERASESPRTPRTQDSPTTPGTQSNDRRWHRNHHRPPECHRVRPPTPTTPTPTTPARLHRRRLHRRRLHRRRLHRRRLHRPYADADYTVADYDHAVAKRPTGAAGHSRCHKAARRSEEGPRLIDEEASAAVPARRENKSHEGRNEVLFPWRGRQGRVRAADRVAGIGQERRPHPPTHRQLRPLRSGSAEKSDQEPDRVAQCQSALQ